MPMIHAGGGVVHAQAFSELQELATLLCAPITTSWGARSVVDERSIESIPFIYKDVVTRIRNDADVALVLGSRMGETDGWGAPPHWAPASSQDLIQVDLDPEILGSGRATDLAVQADVKEFLMALIDTLKKKKHMDHLDGRRKKIKTYQKSCGTIRNKLDKLLADKDAPLNPAQVPAICREIFDDDAILAIDGGRTTVWSHYFHQVRVPNTLLEAPKMGYVGSGPPHAIGAKANSNSFIKHAQYVRGPHRVVHVRLGIVRDKCTAILEQLSLRFIHMDAVGQNCLWTQSTGILVALHHPLSVLLQAIVLVRNILCSMDVNTNVCLSRHRHGALQRRLGDGHGSVQPEHTAQHIPIAIHLIGKLNVLCHSSFQ